MDRRNRELATARRGFTLVELLVVITIIGMLMALLMPAVSSAIAAGRLHSCKNNQAQISKALMAYETAHQAYPGWRNSVTTNSGAKVVVAWPAMILPNLERGDLWGNLKGGLPYMGTYLRIFSCPSDPPDTTTGVGPSAYTANGLILRDPTLNPPLPPQSQDYVTSADGTSYTLLLSENTRVPPTAALASGATAKAHNWYDYTSPITQTFGYPITNTKGTPYTPALVTFAAAYGADKQVQWQCNDRQHQLIARRRRGRGVLRWARDFRPRRHGTELRHQHHRRGRVGQHHRLSDDGIPRRQQERMRTADGREPVSTIVAN